MQDSLYTRGENPKMFKKNLYITKGINEEMPLELINILWLKVQGETDRQLDYLQVFEFKNVGPNDAPVLEVKWSQEEPEHMQFFYVKGINTDVEKVWIICNGE